MKRLLVFCGFAHDPQGVLAAVHRFALMGIEPCLNIRIRNKQVGLELRIATFADSDEWRGAFHDPQLALGHVQSVAHSEGWA